jgi:3-dehydroquinate synthase
MKQQTYSFSTATVTHYYDALFSELETIVPKANAVVITDENVYAAHTAKFEGWKTIQLPAGEQFKTQATVDRVILQLIEWGADRTTTLIGVGGGVITDITGYIACVYMRGIRFGFVPTSILALVDASIGGKNGIDVGVYKNMVGVIRQPSFLFHDLSFLHSLPHEEWMNGFAEIIKHAAIKDAAMLEQLAEADINYYQTNEASLKELILRNFLIKTSVVQSDEFEKGERKLLNFGHTLGHAIENEYQLMHGHAISIGMAAAATISEEINNFPSVEKAFLIEVLEKYQLPVRFSYDKTKAFEVLQKDKKKEQDFIHYILLNRLGEAVSVPISFVQLQDLFTQNL